MRSFSRAWVILAVCIAICCGVTTVASASLLRDVRVGEHEDFTRLVFEFDSPARYSPPVLKDKDTIAVTFLKSKTPDTLTRRNLQRSTRHFNTVTFEQRGSDLTVHVTVTPPHFKIKAFSLLKPSRVVIDVHWLDAPLQTTVAPPPVPLMPEKTEPKRTKKVTASPKPQKEDVPVMITPEKIAKIPAVSLTRPDKVAVSGPSQTTLPGTIQLAQATLRYSRLQLYLMVVLIALNIIVIIIFTVILWFCLRKIEFPKYGVTNEIADAFAVQDSTAVSIDSEIRKKFQKYEVL
ncbi:MAG: hypothetical protein JRD69_01615 [Deltaproteobacteria bacterium]|nr:hypothetical protein [Deltaproteobacteria bacterium]